MSHRMQHLLSDHLGGRKRVSNDVYMVSCHAFMSSQVAPHWTSKTDRCVTKRFDNGNFGVHGHATLEIKMTLAWEVFTTLWLKNQAEQWSSCTRNAGDQNASRMGSLHDSLAQK